MARIFVSYSRKNKDFCRQLTDELQKREIDYWVDWNDIDPTVKWKDAIGTGIEDADNFLAIVTPDWIISPICLEELNIAVMNGKRLIPVVPCELKWDDVPAVLGDLNFIFFTEAYDFNQQFDTLLTALNTDYEWVNRHTRLQAKALEWERNNRENGFLLHGKELEEAEAQISINANKDPKPTDLQRDYVLKSRQAATRQRRITTSILIGLIAGMLGVIVLLVRPYVEEAIARFQAQQLSSMVSVPAGEINFQLGDRFHQINLAEFSVDRQPVTNRVYGLCVNVNRCTPPVGSDDYLDPVKSDEPVMWITIVQAATYCEWVGRRLPTAPEWEQAVAIFIIDGTNNNYAVSTSYEWTASYTMETWQGAIDAWDGTTGNLQLLDWIFLQENAVMETAGEWAIYTNPGGAYAASADLGFRCAR